MTAAPALTTLSDHELRSLTLDKVIAADTLMTDLCQGSPDALSFGWDWPTFAAYFPEQYAEIRRIKAEGRRRGLK